jgi:hypothetical protein
MATVLRKTGAGMNPFYLLAIISLVLVPSTATFAETYFASSCSTALEKLHTARNALIPFQRSMERARIHERVALGETVTCGPGGIVSLQRAQRCSRATWEAPQRIKETLEAEDVYLQERRAFEVKLEWVKQVCPVEP